jgi:uncharacterized protein
LPFLAALFAIVACVYASAGFGGGSTYTALLVLWKTEYLLIPVISLLCNLTVVSSGSLRFYNAKLYDFKAILPLFAASIPLAFLGGQYPLKEQTFLIILAGALMLSSIALLVPLNRLSHIKLSQPITIGISGLVGLLAGLSGIGGGIFMAPILHIIRWAEPRRIAAFASLFILVNSVATLAGQLNKNGNAIISDVYGYLPLIFAVLIGGQIGGHVSLKYFPSHYLRAITAFLTGYVSISIIWKIAHMP